MIKSKITQDNDVTQIINSLQYFPNKDEYFNDRILSVIIGTDCDKRNNCVRKPLLDYVVSIKPEKFVAKAYYHGK